MEVYLTGAQLVIFLNLVTVLMKKKTMGCYILVRLYLFQVN